MKGISLPVNIIIVLVLAVLVLVAITYLLSTSSQTSGQGITNENIFRALCQKWVTINCNKTQYDNIQVTVSGKTYKFADTNICSDATSCATRCGC